MKVAPFRSIGGLCLYLHDDTGGSDVGRIKIRREDLSAVAVACIAEIGFDASPELLEICRQFTEASQDKSG